MVAWGSNSNGQLGTGDTIQRNSTVQISGLSDITQVSAGGYFSVALSSIFFAKYQTFD